MKINNKIMVFVVISLIASTVISGCLESDENGVTPGTGIIIIPAVTGSYSDNPKNAMASYYSSKELTISSSVAQYTLPLALSTTNNFDKIDTYFSISAKQKELLKTNGFVVIKHGYQEDDTIDPYTKLKENDIPIFITSDTLLHLYHVQFDEILKGIEEREFFDNILNMSKLLFDQSKTDYQTFEDNLLKDAARKNVAFFTIGLSLLQTPTEEYNGSEDIYEIVFSVPSYVEDEVNEELSLIDAHSGFSESPLFHYNEDYSQYVPRGHYTRSEKLKRYFKTMMWYGRISFLMKGGDPYCQGCDYLISEEESNKQTIQASLISTMLPNLEIDDQTAKELWDRIYTVTSFFVGTADDLTPYEYLDSIQQIFGSEFNVSEFADEEKLFDLKVELAQLRNPEIYGGTGNVALNPVAASKKEFYEVLNKTKGMRMMGQRFVPDSYMFQQLVYPNVGKHTGQGTPFTFGYTGAGTPTRVFPRGLDVMSVLGSERASEILELEGDTEYVDYSNQINMLKDSFSEDNINVSQWNRNLYWSWLYTLKSLIKEYDDSYPTFMQQTAWLDKELQTSLASWSQLRHDTILYAKQSYTVFETGISEPPQETKGYVEPAPEFYNRLKSLIKMTNDGLNELDVLTQIEISRLESLESVLSRLIEISINILEDKALSDDDYDYIQDFGNYLEYTVFGVKEEGQQTTIIADVHTDANSQKCLEEGVGYVDIMIVAYVSPGENNVILGAGPVLSYHEFKQPMSSRLTDEKWKEILEGEIEEGRQGWISSFMIE